MVWGSFLIAAAALKTRTRNGYNAQGVNLTFFRSFVLKIRVRRVTAHAARLVKVGSSWMLYLACFVTVFLLPGLNLDPCFVWAWERSQVKDVFFIPTG